MIISTNIVKNTLHVAQYASICTSEKGIPNEIVKTSNGHDVVSDQGTMRFIQEENK